MTVASSKAPEFSTPGLRSTAAADQRSPQFLLGFGDTAREIWQYRELLGNLVRKELKVKYKDSVLGFVWSLLMPLVQLGVYWLVIGKFLGAGSIPTYGVYIFCGLATWTLFSEILSTSTTSVVYNSGLVKKVYFPRELFPLAATGAALVNFGFQLVILLVADIIAGISTGKWPDLRTCRCRSSGCWCWWSGPPRLGLLLAAANVYLRDIEHLIGVVLMLWFWVTPIIYNASRVSKTLPGGAVPGLSDEPDGLGGVQLPEVLLAAGRRVRFRVHRRHLRSAGHPAGGRPGLPVVRAAGLRPRAGQLRAGALAMVARQSSG